MPELPVSPHIRYSLKRNGIALIKWLCLAVLVGLTVGLVGSLFHIVLEWATETRTEYPWLLYLLPVAGLAVVGVYRLLDMSDDKGTEMVLTAIRSGQPMRLRTAPLIFFATALTHLCGGSAGREGAALQLGGSISDAIGKLFHLREGDEKIITMCGMAAGFSALFGTPVSAAVFAMEVERIGVMQYVAIVPCLVASLLASGVASCFGISATSFTVVDMPELDLKVMVAIVVFGVLCGILANLFCRAMGLGGAFYRKITDNPWLKAVIGGCIIIALTLLLGTRDYNGAGMDVIQRALEGEAAPLAFVLKIAFTALTLGAGYKGGEIVPSFFVGATFGCVAAPLLGLSSSFGGALAMVAVFCGVTNSPMTSILLGCEMFADMSIAPIALVVAVSYMTSGYHSLYHQQKITYSKFQAKQIDTFSGDGSDE
ncbi:MAG: chloride channel protein [Clostridiales bacterium]|nr:chloride channel protein [Clostridiales bacterium]